MTEAEISIKRLRWRGALLVLFLGPWFFLCYGYANHATSLKPVVATCYWGWERHIPFVPSFVVPYMSLDLLFVIAFFLPRSQAELTVLAKRIFAVITLSCLCFLLWPLQYEIPRPMPEGWTAPWFKALYAGDLPFNQAPSLHISQRCLLWVTFGRHMVGWKRFWLRNWFILIGASTMLTWQHHFIDVVTGFLMAYFIVALVPEKETMPVWKWRSPESRRLAWFYGIGAAICGGLALLGGAWLWLGWPAVALGFISTAYATGDTRWLQKSSGAPVPAVEWIFMPIIAIARLWQMQWMFRKPAWQELSPGVFFGRMLTNKEASKFLEEHPKVTVIDLTAESKEAAAFREKANYIPMPVLDLTPVPPDLREDAVEKIREHSKNGPVYVHCLLGIGRTSQVAQAWLQSQGREITLSEARGLLYIPK